MAVLKLNLTREPQWYELLPGVRLRLRPLTTTLMIASRADPAVEALPETATNEERAIAFAKALARRAVVEWEGIEDETGNPVPVTPEAIDAAVDVWPIFEALQTQYVSKGLLLEQEKNVSALSPSGISAGAGNTVQPVAAGSAESARPD